MPFGQQSVYFHLTATIAVFSFFAIRFWGLYSAGAYVGPGGLADVGILLLWLMVASIAAMIVVSILGSIILAIAHRDPAPDFTRDERDRAIEARGWRVSQAVTGAGFVGCMILLALGTDAALVFFLMFASFALGDVAGNMNRLAAYYRG
ncbi:MAG: hypothetical protein WBA92_02290 [Pseudorhodobacter sp.]